MTKKRYSARINPKKITIKGVYWKLQHLYLLLCDKGYFKEKLGIVNDYIPDVTDHEAALELSFSPFPVNKWKDEWIMEDKVFDIIEFLHDRVSKPGALIQKVSETGWQYEDYDGYDGNLGRIEYRELVNSFLCDYVEGFELRGNGEILALGEQSIRPILDAVILPYDEENVDSKVRSSILKWRNRRMSLEDKKSAIRDMADVFEWLKTKRGLMKVVSKDDTDGIFRIANNFHIRQHNPNQKNNYDKNIWYSWIFHFYLATYHASVRLLIQEEKKMGNGAGH